MPSWWEARKGGRIKSYTEVLLEDNATLRKQLLEMTALAQQNGADLATITKEKQELLQTAKTTPSDQCRILCLTAEVAGLKLQKHELELEAIRLNGKIRIAERKAERAEDSLRHQQDLELIRLRGRRL